MTVSRASVLITGFALLALGVVYLRGEQTRAAARAVALELQQVQARRELWRAQAAVARLRAPTQIRDRMDRYPEALRSARVDDSAALGLHRARDRVVD